MTGANDHDIVIIGGGFAGSLLALRLAALGARPTLIDPVARPGAGLAYGQAQACHLLNVPVARMEIGLTPGFEDWLGAQHGDAAKAVAEAVVESHRLSQAFVPRYLFGRYLRERMAEALVGGRVRHVRGIASGLDVTPLGAVVRLVDGRTVTAQRMVLASGNAPPRVPVLGATPSHHVQDHPGFIADPWAHGALEDIGPQAEVLIIGTGLTAVDLILSLRLRGHAGPIHLWSRRGRLPAAHLAGGHWSPFLDRHAGRSPGQILRVLRAEVMAAERQQVPWQRVMDAARPALAAIWQGWSLRQRAQFLRHGRALWDVHRHRMAPRIAAQLDHLRSEGQVHVHAGRFERFEVREGGGLRLWLRSGDVSRAIDARHAIACTGPETDPARMPGLIQESLAKGLIVRDRLGLGLETRDGRCLNRDGVASQRLFALGSLTRPAWWEITAVPEIAAQTGHLAEVLADRKGSASSPPILSNRFVDLGAGI